MPHIYGVELLQITFILYVWQKTEWGYERRQYWRIIKIRIGVNYLSCSLCSVFCWYGADVHFASWVCAVWSDQAIWLLPKDIALIIMPDPIIIVARTLLRQYSLTDTGSRRLSGCWDDTLEHLKCYWPPVWNCKVCKYDLQTCAMLFSDHRSRLKYLKTKFHQRNTKSVRSRCMWTILEVKNMISLVRTSAI